MKKVLFALIIPSLWLCHVAHAERWGERISAGDATSLAAAINTLGPEQRAQVLLTATVSSVCEKKGCWLGLTDADNTIRVRFKDYGFFVPFALVGKTVKVEGLLEKVQLSLADSKHFVEDAGGDPASVTQPITEYQLVASGVELLP